MIFGKRTITADDLIDIIASHAGKPMPSGEELDKALDDVALVHALLFTDFLQESGHGER